ncbi:ribbon-helix-helix protein, CopG family [uncultured Thiodictyon sp.]|uniref:ribbon-helix-helix protein, CopG family n=1 Tax=uncultured Thiodictyon sp. TaxID=1846217 RepID=UPI0025E2B6C0|nr:ribbon-helix-helix protein, CopG family [uncultured Thiodictyon sp.]
MTISVRLDPATEAALRRQVLSRGVPLSEFVRDAIREKLAAADMPNTPYAIGKAVFGRYASGDTDRSVHRKEVLRDRFRDPHRR